MRENGIAYVMARQDGAIIVDKTENALQAFQSLVDGYIETTPAVEAMPHASSPLLGITAVLNEEGRLRTDMCRNALIPWLYGNVVFIDTQGDEFCGLSARKVQAVISALMQ